MLFYEKSLRLHVMLQSTGCCKTGSDFDLLAKPIALHWFAPLKIVIMLVIAMFFWLAFRIVYQATCNSLSLSLSRQAPSEKDTAHHVGAALD